MTTMDYAMRVATQFQAEGKLESARLILNGILNVKPEHAFAIHLSGIIAYQSGDIPLGIQLLQQAIENNPSFALFHSNLGEMYRLSKNILLSIQHGERAITLDPNSAIALSNLGLAYYDAKKYDQAEACHTRALAIQPNLGTSLNNMGSIYKMLGKTQRAIVFYQAAIANEPHFVEPINNLGALYLEQHDFHQAFSYLEQAIALNPLFADAQCNMGFALQGLDRYEDSLLHFKKALEFQPHYAEAYYGIAKVYWYEQNFMESEFYLRKAMELNPQQMEFYQLLAELHHEQGKSEQALKYLDDALSVDATLSSLLMSKGNILMEMGEISRAKEQFLKISEDSKVDTRLLAHYSLSQICKLKRYDPNLEKLLFIANNIQEVSLSKQVYVYFALGKCYDDIGECEKAFAYFTQGCGLKRKKITYRIEEQIQLTQKIIKEINEETVEYLRRFANPSALPIFIVGMPRSGSTLVEQILAKHPHVWGGGELKYFTHLIKENLFYHENILKRPPENYCAITHKYLASLKHFSSEALHITDKMPQNFMAIGFIHGLFPNAKIIHVKRNPIDTCLSCYTKLFNQGHYYSYDLTELGQYYHCYEKMMDHWRHVLPANAWLDVDYEKIIHNLENEAKRLLDYCNLPWNSDCLNFYESKRNVRTASFMQVRQPLYHSSIHRWRKFEKELQPLIKILNSFNPIPA